jgi:hypothetical protein
MKALWYALFKGELCRILKDGKDRLICQVWRNGFWVQGPDFSKLDFTGRRIPEDEARKWIQNQFREKAIKTHTNE